MDVADHVGLRERIEIAVVLEILLRVREAFAANIGLGQSVGANGRAHRAVDDGDAFAENPFQLFNVVSHRFFVGQRNGKRRMGATKKSTYLDTMICYRNAVTSRSRPMEV